GDEGRALPEIDCRGSEEKDANLFLPDCCTQAAEGLCDFWHLRARENRAQGMGGPSRASQSMSVFAYRDQGDVFLAGWLSDPVCRFFTCAGGVARYFHFGRVVHAERRGCTNVAGQQEEYAPWRLPACI